MGALPQWPEVGAGGSASCPVPVLYRPCLQASLGRLSAASQLSLFVLGALGGHVLSLAHVCLGLVSISVGAGNYRYSLPSIFPINLVKNVKYRPIEMGKFGCCSDAVTNCERL